MTKTIRDYIVITIGSVIFAASISLFLDPTGLTPGGASGIAVILNHTIGLSTGLVIFAINIPLLIIGFFKIGKKFVIRTLYSTIIYSILIDISEKKLSKIIPLTSDLLLTACAGGALMALSMGIIYRFGGSTGGTDIVTKLIRKRVRYAKTGAVYLVVDTTIIIASAITFKSIDIPLYSAISVVITSLLLNNILYSNDEAKLLFIISKHDVKIADLLLTEADLGVTYLEGQGVYTNTSEKILFCAVHKQDYYKVKDIVKREDQQAFMIVTNASEIYGKGYKRHGAEEL